jgi:tRNA(Ile)-lysidine synthetase-like protein
MPELHESAEAMQIAIPGRCEFAGHLVETSVVKASAEKLLTLKGRDSFTECFDLDRLKPPLTVRFRRDGDRFIPFGSMAEKKIGKFLTDQRVPRKTRQGTLIVEDAGNIIWLWPVRMSNSAKITEETKNLIQMRITPPGQ